MTAAPLAAQETARRELGDWRGVLCGNSLDNDPVFARLLERLMGEGFPAAAERLRAVAESSGPALDALVVESNRDENLPVLRRHDPLGRRVEEVVFHPAHHEAGRVFWRSGVLGVLREPGQEVLSGAIAYLLDQQGEGGHACPVACTAPGSPFWSPRSNRWTRWRAWSCAPSVPAWVLSPDPCSGPGAAHDTSRRPVYNRG